MNSRGNSSTGCFPAWDRQHSEQMLGVLLPLGTELPPPGNLPPPGTTAPDAGRAVIPRLGYRRHYDWKHHRVDSGADISIRRLGIPRTWGRWKGLNARPGCKQIPPAPAEAPETGTDMASTRPVRWRRPPGCSNASDRETPRRQVSQNSWAPDRQAGDSHQRRRRAPP